MKLFNSVLTLTLCLITFNLFAQQVDKVIDMGNYKSYYSYGYKNPLYVTYTLKNGGGECDRSNFKFKSCGVETALQSDYNYSGFEEGHMANAEDFAYDCILDKNTFCFYNCVPQTRKLNRGIWKTWEGKVRTLSHQKTIFIIAGAIYGDKVLKPGSKVRIPTYCYKIVIDPPNGAVLYCLLFPNDDSDNYRQIDLQELKTMLGYPLLSQNALHLQ